MGFQVSSQADWMESTKQQSSMIQAVLGGIGAVSLFVAAIGIANTMMMSIYERTKEIGVMKVLGCDMGNIRNMFLIESGFIGFHGRHYWEFCSVTVSRWLSTGLLTWRNERTDRQPVQNTALAFRGSRGLCHLCGHGRRIYAGYACHEAESPGSHPE